MRALLENDLALVLSERFVQSAAADEHPEGATVSLLPFPTTSFIGRHKEVADLRRLLTRRDVRLVTLSGPGGVGKTRLSLEVGHALRSVLTGGVFFISLASTTDPLLVLTSIQQQLGIRPQGAEQPVDRLIDHLRRTRTLLILDTFEQIVAAAPDLARLLAACPELKLLVTSRTSLRVRGEHGLYFPRDCRLPAVRGAAGRKRR